MPQGGNTQFRWSEDARLAVSIVIKFQMVVNGDALYEEGARIPRMMSIGLAPYVTGRPVRMQALEEILRY